jgi:hypothetical protein
MTTNSVSMATPQPLPNPPPAADDAALNQNANIQADFEQPSGAPLAYNDQYFDDDSIVADTGARTLVKQDEVNSRMNVESNPIGATDGTLVAGRYQITCSDDPATEAECRETRGATGETSLRSYVPNITVSPNTYQGKEVRYNAGVKPGEHVAGYSQQDSRWGGMAYTWAPGKPKFDWGGRVKNWEGEVKGTWGDVNGIGGIGCTATAFTNGLRAVNPSSGVTPVNAAKLDNKFWNAVNATNFRDLSGQSRSVSNRAVENTLIARPNGKQWGPGIEQMNPPVDIKSPKGEQMVDEVRRSLQDGKPVLLGFRNNTPDANGQRAVRHSSLAVGYANGQIQILDSETGKVGPMDEFLRNYGYDTPQFDYAYEMSRK